MEHKDQRAAHGEHVGLAGEEKGWTVESASVEHKKGPQWPDGFQSVRLREGRPTWHVSSLEKGGAEVASQQRLNRGRSMCGSTRGTRHQHADGHDGLAKNPND